MHILHEQFIYTPAGLPLAPAHKYHVLSEMYCDSEMHQKQPKPYANYTDDTELKQTISHSSRHCAIFYPNLSVRHTKVDNETFLPFSQQFSNMDETEMREKFDEMDTDGSGCVGLTELKAFLQAQFPNKDEDFIMDCLLVSTNFISFG